MSRQGRLYRIEKGAGCGGGPSSEGQPLFIRSPGPFAGAGSELLSPHGGGYCPIADSSEL